MYIIIYQNFSNKKLNPIDNIIFNLTSFYFILFFEYGKPKF